MLTTQDYNVNLKMPWRLLLAGSFNDHVIHHLLPTLDLSKQHVVRPVLEATYREFKVRTEAERDNDHGAVA